jgi:membrane-associated phospholipid phosphatase
LDPSPAPTSAQAAAEMLEVYAMSLVRDIPFDQWSDDNPDISFVIQNLNLVKNDLNGPTIGGQITVQTLFRGPTTGDIIGPYVSQFLYHPTAIGALQVSQKYDSAPAYVDYLTSVSAFLAKWSAPTPAVALIDTPRYKINLRDCANYIHLDPPWQPFYTAALILLKITNFSYTTTNRVGARFINLGVVDLYNIMSEAGKLAMNATWMVKWCQLRFRPEEMAYQIHLKKTEGQGLNFPDSLMDNPILGAIFAKNVDNYLCPQAYPEGCPNHPSYPSGHATLAGSMVTILKAFFNCNKPIAAKVPNADGSALENLLVNGQPVNLNIGDELDKLASNCSIFRNLAGIHYRTDYSGVILGEQVAIQLLEEMSTRYEGKVTFTLKKFNGQTITITNNK